MGYQWSFQSNEDDGGEMDVEEGVVEGVLVVGRRRRWWEGEEWKGGGFLLLVVCLVLWGWGT